MGDDEGYRSDSGHTRDAFQKAAGEVLAQRIEAIALEVRSISSPEEGTFASNETLSILALTLQTTLRKIDEIFEFDGFAVSPACTIMLELFQARARGGPLSIFSLCQALNCPAPVVRRWVDVLETMQLLQKWGDVGGDEPRAALTEKGYLRTAQALQLLL